jgi:hypothetical protein
MSGWMVIDITSFTKTTTADKVKKILKTVRHAPPPPRLARWVAGSILTDPPALSRYLSQAELYLIHREKIDQERGTEGCVIAGTARKAWGLFQFISSTDEKCSYTPYRFYNCY